jgi:hypothetical protein
LCVENSISNHGLSLHKSCQDSNFPYFWPVKKIGMWDCRRNKSDVCGIDILNCKCSCLLYSNVCANKYCKFILNYPKLFGVNT